MAFQRILVALDRVSESSLVLHHAHCSGLVAQGAIPNPSASTMAMAPEAVAQ